MPLQQKKGKDLATHTYQMHTPCSVTLERPATGQIPMVSILATVCGAFKPQAQVEALDRLLLIRQRWQDGDGHRPLLAT